MKREFIISIDAPARYQPTQDEIFAEVQGLVNKRRSEFPPKKDQKGGTSVGIIRRHRIKQ